MWQCAKCREQIEDAFDACWKCGTSKEGVENLEFRRAEDMPPEELKEDSEHESPKRPLIDCLRCGVRLEFAGTKNFQEGPGLAFTFGGFGPVFASSEKLDAYCCPACGQVEFFVSGFRKGGEHA